MALVILAHPHFDDSVANKTIIDELQKSGLPFEIKNLIELYPNYHIDVAAEQASLLQHQIVLFQYPFYWYSMPAIMKQWFDSVFVYQFAYGSLGDQLKNKDFIISITVGGAENDYAPTGKHGYTIDHFTYNLRQTAHLTQMNFIDPLFCYGVSHRFGNTKDQIIARAKQHAHQIIALVKSRSTVS